jgi:hypothetical protein
MASMERLTKRVKKMEEWIADNEDTGGPAGTLETINYLLNEIRRMGPEIQNNQMAYQRMRQLTFGFLESKKLESEWDEYVKEQDNAVQKQQAEEVPAQEEAESGEEAVEAPEEKNK